MDRGVESLETNPERRRAWKAVPSPQAVNNEDLEADNRTDEQTNPYSAKDDTFQSAFG